MSGFVILVSMAIGILRFSFGSIPAHINSPIAWYVTVAHFWVGALFLVVGCSRFTKNERVTAGILLAGLTLLKS